jgi:DNA-binding MurR/RpiR family transcriptional regulator
VDRKPIKPGLMTDISAFVAEVRAVHSRLPPKLQEIAEYSYLHPDNMALDSITELSGHMGVHPSALVRFAQHFGFSGFSELQRLYRTHLRNQSQGYGSRLNHIDDITSEDVLLSVSQSAVRSAKELLDSLNRDALAEATERIAAAGTVWLAGTGRTLAVQIYFQYLFTGVGITSHVLECSIEHIPKQISLMDQNDVMIATSFHPYSQWTCAMVTEARDRGVVCVSLTDTQVSPICGAINLLYGEDQFAGFRSLSATMNLALYLAIESGRKRKERLIANQEHKHVIS